MMDLICKRVCVNITSGQKYVTIPKKGILQANQPVLILPVKYEHFHKLTAAKSNDDIKALLLDVMKYNEELSSHKQSATAVSESDQVKNE